MCAWSWGASESGSYVADRRSGHGRTDESTATVHESRPRKVESAGSRGSRRADTFSRMATTWIVRRTMSARFPFQIRLEQEGRTVIAVVDELVLEAKVRRGAGKGRGARWEFIGART